MTHQEINQAIAEACGWTDVQVGTLSKELIGKSPTDGDYWPIASYVSDLNAMWEAEGTLNEDQLWQMAREIEKNWEDQWYFRATARQRAEAFLKTLGKWEDGE
jgi:hypothetical protein